MVAKKKAQKKISGGSRGLEGAPGESMNDWEAPPDAPESNAAVSTIGQVIWEKMEADPNFLPTKTEAVAVLNSLGGSDFGRMEYAFALIDEHPEREDEIKKSMNNRELRVVKEILNKEYIAAFGDYLAKRVLSLGGSKENPITILEVGAGDGRLSELLAAQLEKLVPGKFKTVASDSQADKIKQKFPVENSDCDTALKKHKPNLVISSWMPAGVDFSASIRATPSVSEYILIGEVYGSCGKEGVTFNQALINKDGFDMESVTALSKYQVCRLDDSTDLTAGEKSRSTTTSFKKQKTPLLEVFL